MKSKKHLFCVSLGLVVFALMAACQTYPVREGLVDGQLRKVRTIYANDFSKSKKLRALIPHRYKTTDRIAELKNGTLLIPIRSGIHGASTDEKRGVDRAEYAVPIPANKLVRQRFKIRVETELPHFFPRFMVAQMKWEQKKGSRKSYSPSVAIYINNYGQAKCTTFDPYPNRQIHGYNNGQFNIADGKWHEVEMLVRFSDVNGECCVNVDGVELIRMNGVDTIPPYPSNDPKERRARIGVYRDTTSQNVDVYYDDWIIEVSE